MSYVKNIWNTGDVITKPKLDNMENGIEFSANKVNNLDRYQAEFGFDGAALNGCFLSNQNL